MTPLTPWQKEIYNFVVQETIMYGRPPTLREIAKHFDRALSTIRRNLDLIITKGWLRKTVPDDPGRLCIHRNLEVVNKDAIRPH